jgi:hypothetical protein
VGSAAFLMELTYLVIYYLCFSLTRQNKWLWIATVKRWTVRKVGIALPVLLLNEYQQFKQDNEASTSKQTDANSEVRKVALDCIGAASVEALCGGLQGL